MGFFYSLWNIDLEDGTSGQQKSIFIIALAQMPLIGKLII